MLCATCYRQSVHPYLVYALSVVKLTATALATCMTVPCYPIKSSADWYPMPILLQAAEFVPDVAPAPCEGGEATSTGNSTQASASNTVKIDARRRAVKVGSAASPSVQVLIDVKWRCALHFPRR